MFEMFLPRFEGELEVADVPEDMTARLATRVEQGLIEPGNRKRANYEVAGIDAQSIRFQAMDFWTALNVGLNDVVVRVTGPNRVTYAGSFWMWTRYCVALCAGVALSLIGLFHLFPQIMTTVRSTPSGPAILWGNVVFWGLAWPWLLTALHKRPAAHCLERIIREEIGEDQTQLAGAASAYRSAAEIFGLPLVNIGRGQNGPVRGVIAIGPFAQGIVAIGGHAQGVIAIGGLAIGGVAIGGMAIGAVAVGGVAIGVLHLGAAPG